MSACAELQVLEDRVALRAGRRRARHRDRELLLREPEVGRHARHLVAAQAVVERRHDRVVAAQPATRTARRPPPARRGCSCRDSPRRSRGRSRDRRRCTAGCCPRWPSRGRPARAPAASVVRNSSESIASVRCRTASAPRAGHRRGHAVHRLPALPRGELPVGERADVADRVADAGPQLLARAAADVVEVDHHGERDGDAVGGLAALVLERGDRRGQAVVGEAGGDGDHRAAR